MNKRLINVNQTSGLHSFGHFDSDGEMVAVTEELPWAVAESCRKMAAHVEENRGSYIGNTQTFTGGRAVIPTIFVNMLMREGRYETQDPVAFQEWLHGTPEGKHFLGK